MVIAHQGGWDEALLVALPIAVFAAILWVANRRAAASLEDEPEVQDPPADA